MLPQQPPEYEAPAPLLPAASTSRPPESQTRAVLAIVFVFVLVLCGLAYCGLRSVGGGGGGNDTLPVIPTGGATATATGTSSAVTSSAPPSGGKLKIQRAQGFDPQGDGSEKESLTKLAYDAKASTGWTSDTYRSPTWGGLKKGVGLRLDLGSAQTVHSATLQIGGTGAKFQLLAVTGDSLSGSTVLGQGRGADGPVTVTFATPRSTRYVVVWFTTPGQFSDGYRAEIDDVSLR